MFLITVALNVDTDDREAAEAIRGNLEESLDYYDAFDFGVEGIDLAGSTCKPMPTEPARAWVVVVTWSEPEPGVSVYGPYDSREAAYADAVTAKDGILSDFTNEPDGRLPEDVELEIQELSR